MELVFKLLLIHLAYRIFVPLFDPLDRIINLMSQAAFDNLFIITYKIFSIFPICHFMPKSFVCNPLPLILWCYLNYLDVQ